MNTNHYAYFVAIHFEGSDKSYYFGTNDNTLQPNDFVIVDTVSGFELAIVSKTPESTDTYQSDLELKPVIRRASAEDIEDYEFGKKQAKVAMKIADREAKNLNLGMTFVNANYTLDGTKVTLSYTAEGRVDFRELLRILASQLKCRIELHQIAPRDKAKMVGGMGICGLPLCCSTFLNAFDGISISRAKNQMLTLNIPKLSGACGRLMCCLLYEDDLYTEAKKDFPKIGTSIHTSEGDYTVASFNVISRSVKLVSETDVQYVTIEDFKMMSKPGYRKPQPAPQPTPSKIDVKVNQQSKESNDNNRGKANNKPKQSDNQNNNQRNDNHNSDRNFRHRRNRFRGKGDRNNNKNNA